MVFYDMSDASFTQRFAESDEIMDARLCAADLEDEDAEYEDDEDEDEDYEDDDDEDYEDDDEDDD
jgi:hypothetical protein